MARSVTVTLLVQCEFNCHEIRGEGCLTTSLEVQYEVALSPWLQANSSLKDSVQHRQLRKMPINIGSDYEIEI